MNAATLLALPPRFLELIAGRAARRFLARYTRARGSRKGSQLIRQVAELLEHGNPDPDHMLGIAEQLNSEYEATGAGPLRFPLAWARSLCGKNRVRTILNLNVPCDALDWLPKTARHADESLWAEVIRADVNAAVRAHAAGAALPEFGPLWVPREPNWLRFRWPTKRDEQARLDAAWGLDRPTRRIRAAPLRRLSRDLPEGLQEAFEPIRFLMHFVSERETEVPATMPGRLSIPISREAGPAHRIATPGAHAFRRPAPSASLNLLRGRYSHPALQPLWTFLREHDGALLVRALNAERDAAYIDLLGVADQPLARAQAWYDARSAKPSGDELWPIELRRQLDCKEDDLWILAETPRCFIVIPMVGSHAGKAFRIGAYFWRAEPWADSMIQAVKKLVTKIAPMCRKSPMLVAVTPGSNTFNELRLVRVSAVRTKGGRR